MARMLVLVRHGKTERRTEDKDDYERELTEAGRRSLEATLPRALSILEDMNDIYIWSSPAKRALQTAQVVARALETSDIYEHSSLYGHDIEAFLHEVACHDGCIVAVGHNPFLEELFERLTGFHQTMGKGAVAAFELVADDPDSAQLVWFVQGPDDTRWKTLVKMEKVLAKVAKRLSSTMWALLDDPDDVETLHSFRIAIRTARSLLVFIEPYQKRKQNRRSEDDLRSIVRQTSHLRELDMFCAEVGHSQDAYDVSSDGGLGHECHKKRDAERMRMMKVLESTRMQRRLHRAVRVMSNIKWRSHVQAAGLPAETLTKRFDDMQKSYEDALGKLDLSDAEATHALRKQAKRQRYIAKEFASLLDEDAASVSGDMEAMQDELGLLCDARVNQGLIATLEAGDLAEDARRELETLNLQQHDSVQSVLGRLHIYDSDTKA